MFYMEHASTTRKTVVKPKVKTAEQKSAAIKNKVIEKIVSGNTVSKPRKKTFVTREKPAKVKTKTAKPVKNVKPKAEKTNSKNSAKTLKAKQKVKSIVSKKAVQATAKTKTAISASKVDQSAKELKSLIPVKSTKIKTPKNSAKSTKTKTPENKTAAKKVLSGRKTKTSIPAQKVKKAKKPASKVFVKTRRPRPLKIVTAEPARYVNDFADEIQTFYSFAFHCLR